MDSLIPLNRKYEYPSLVRIDSPNGRTYKRRNDTTKAVPSVTTILSATKDMSALDAWVERVGQAEADRIKNDAAYVGTAMHLALECLVVKESLPAPSNWLEVKGYEMAYLLANTYFRNIQEYWGSEVSLLYPESYAGTTDLVGVYRSQPAIIDFKQSLKPKRKQWITDYFHQLAAYAVAHDKAHGTNIEFGVILVAIQGGGVQEFTTTGSEFQRYKEEWLERVTDYYAMPSVVSNGKAF